VTHVFHGGKLPAQPARPHLRLAPVLDEATRVGQLAPPPASCLYADSRITWDMLGNDEVGDCTCAEVGHQINQLTWYGSGTEVKPTTAQVIAFYSAITGYNPSKPSTDQGAYVQDVLAYWRKVGLIGHKILAYAAVDVANQTQVKQALALFGSLSVGLNFPDSAMDDFNAGRVWDVVKGAQVEGGHCVMAVGYDAAGVDIITWGARTRVTWAFWKKYVDEAWAALDEDGVQKAGTYFTGLASFYDLGVQFEALTNEPNPIPQPQPTPTPVPSPPPSPTPAADPRLAQAMVLIQEADVLMQVWAHDNGVS
jgi:hypothetical protein